MTSTIYIPRNARCVFTAAKWALLHSGLFSHISADERMFRIRASRGLPIFGENIELYIVATGIDETCVEICSSDKLFYNIFKWGNNKGNIKDISAIVQNEIYRYLPVDNTACYERRSEIKIVPPDIKFKS